MFINMGVVICVKFSNDKYLSEFICVIVDLVQFFLGELLVVCEFGELIFLVLMLVDIVVNGLIDVFWYVLIEVDNYYVL